MAWAMSELDKINAASAYLTYVQKALQFLRDAQYAHGVEYGTNLLANLKHDTTWDKVALTADCAEALLACIRAMDAYGATLTTSGGYSVKTLAKDIYYSLNTSVWDGINKRYRTGYPLNTQPYVPFTYKEDIAYSQALTALATKKWVDSPYFDAATETDYSQNAIDAINRALVMTYAQWGGYLYSPYYGAGDETKYEYSVYTAMMVMAMNYIDATTWAKYITRGREFIKWLTLSDGRVFDFVGENGHLYIGAVKGPGAHEIKEAWCWMLLNPSVGILAGAT